MEKKPEEWDWLAFLLSWHEKEYERRYTLEGLVATPVGLLTGIYALIYLFSTQYDYKHSSALATACLAIPLATSFLLAFISATHVYYSYAVVKNRIYRGVPDANALRKHMGDLVVYYQEHSPQENATEKFKAYFIEILSDQITTNVLNNDERTRDIQKSKPWLRNSLLALICALPAFIYNQIEKPDPIYQVSISTNSTSPMAKQPATPPKVTPIIPRPPQERQIQQVPKPKVK